jgi:putative transcriptional regulator
MIPALVKSPTVDEVRAARIAAGLTQTAAGELVGGSLTTWQGWEYGTRTVSPAVWAMFLLLTSQHPTHRLATRRAPL